ncbi:MAG: glycosyltransferase family 4 protein [Anaerolineae bacterium]|nr:glycosyltransferase family 4 protein [Anaerolineae bacterium]
MKSYRLMSQNMPSSTKIAYIAGSTIPSRTANSLQVMLMCQAMARTGLDVELITPFKLQHWTSRHLDPWEYYGVKPVFKLTRSPYPSPHLFLPHTYFTHYGGADLLAAWQVKQRAPTICYTRSLRVAWTAASQNIPTVYESHFPPPTRSKADRLAAAAKRPSFLAIVAISQALADMLIDIGVPSKKVIVAHDGVDLSRYDPRLSKNEARQQLGLAASQPIAMYAGHLFWGDGPDDGKGTHHIIEAAALLPEVQFVFVGGWDKHIKQTEQITRQFSNVHLSGFIPNQHVPRYLAAADILLMPYTTRLPIAGYFSPLKMFEYMAAGRPIIASSLPTIREVLTDGRNASLIEPGHTEALVAAIRKLLDRPGLASQLGHQAQQDVKHYAWEDRVRRIIHFALAARETL